MHIAMQLLVEIGTKVLIRYKQDLGIGWKSARNKLEEAYNTIPSVYNLTNISSFVDSLKQ